MKHESAIAGVGATPYYFRGQSAPQTLYEMICKAILAAVEDAGLTIRDVDGLAFYSMGFDSGLIAESLGIPELTFASTVSGTGGGSAGVLDLAAMAVETGRAKTVICVGACQQLQIRYGTAFSHMPVTPEKAWERAAGLTGPGQVFALIARRHMHTYGTRREAFAEVVISSRLYAATRESAIRRRPLSIDEYMAAPMLADPLCRLDFTLETDGAVAFVVTSGERARDLKRRPVYIAASAHGGTCEWGRAFHWLNMPDPIFTTAGSEPIAARLYAAAGIGPKEIDVALIYDHFSPLVIMQLEDYGFCHRGEGGAFVESGAIRINGSIPVNPHGGHLSEAYIIGMTHIREAVEQLRGEAVNQIEGAQFALVTGGPAPIPMSGAILRN
ncbi:MAG: thiolase [Rhodospirillaceae bacterium]|nr:MAG: thiolase [Rhodospirillaceae bacterium]